MKNIKKLVTPEEIHEFVMGLWQTDELRESHRNKGMVWDVIERFARMPRIFYEPSDVFTDSENDAGKEYVEAPHFSPWWGAIQLRDYDNKVVQDLYYLHEIEHAGTMPYVANPTNAVKKNKIRTNEHQASTLSEMTVYLEFPTLRRKAFDHPIFVDRFLYPKVDPNDTSLSPKRDFNSVNAGLLQRWKTQPDIVTQEMMYERERILTSKKADVPQEDAAAFWLKRFYSQGKAWTEIWDERYADVEAAMIKLRDECDSLGRAQALDNHIEWLLSDEIAEGTEVPFYSEAKAFAEAYVAEKQKYFDNIRENGHEAVVHNKKLTM